MIGYIYYEAPEEEQNFSTLLEFINASETREEDEEFKNAVDLLFEELEKEELCKEKLLWLMEKRRKVVSILPFVSYGSAELMENECIRDTKIRADQKMYEDKKEHKERKCR